MKRLKRIVRVAVSAGVFAVDGFLRAIHLLAGNEAPKRPVVLAYHSVSDQNRAAFAGQMDKVARRLKALDRVAANLANNRHVLVTFDDGFRNILDNALPELAQRGLPAIVFIVTGTLGSTPNWTDYSDGSDPEMNEPLLTGEEVRQISSDLIEIGSHTVSHPMLPLLSEQQARTQLSASRSALEAITGKEVKFFSFPYGSANPDLVRWCREAGYQQAFITYPRVMVSESNGVVARVKVDPDDWPLEFHLKLHGAYRWRNRWRDYWKSVVV